MSRKTVNIILVLFTISLMGLLLVHFFWIRGSFRAADETFRQLNTTALRSVVQQTGRIANYYNLEKMGSRINHDRNIPIDSILSFCGFEALMRHEFNHYRLHEDYEFGIIDHLTGKLHFSSAGTEQTNLILQSTYARNLRNALDTERYSVVVWFPREQMTMLKKQGTWLFFLSILLFSGIVTGYVVTVSKLISQKKMALIQRDFINNTTHEFKTPLATISIAAEMILNHRQHMPDPQIEKYASIIFEENKRIQHQVDQILQISLLEEESYRFSIKPLDIRRVVEKCVETGRLMLRNTSGIIEFQSNCNKVILADHIHITNVINNLIENGIKYSRGEPHLTITLEATEGGVNLGVRDKGIGIPPDQVRMIFNRLYRVTTGDLYGTTGAGLGLYYVRKIVEAHQGNIHVDSNLGEGSRFEVFLPDSPGHLQPERG